MVVRRLIKRSIASALASCGLTVLRSEKLSPLLGAAELLPDTETPSVDYIPDKKIGHAGFSLNFDRQLSFLRKLSDHQFQKMFRSLRDDPNLNVGLHGTDYRSDGLIHNTYYPTPDAELYASFIAERRPTHIIEVGSGYSTVVARHTIRHAGIDCEIHVIDPEPRRDVADYCSQVEYKRVQDSSLATMEFAKNDRVILFIDSSHVTKMGGDGPFLYCQILPHLPAGILVHIHDIFTPFDYPTNYGRLFYTEQYLLQALLAGNPKFSVLFSTHAMSREYPAEMQAVFGPQVGRDPLFFGASFWMETITN